MEATEKLFNSLVQNDETSAQEHFKTAIQDKLQTALDVKKVAVTSDIFNQSAENEVNS
tara:strand:+ start:310 stop:483 length:174 start_codon:yes stop_codon:yes gene_type:complete